MVVRYNKMRTCMRAHVVVTKPHANMRGIAHYIEMCHYRCTLMVQIEIYQAGKSLLFFGSVIFANRSGES